MVASVPGPVLNHEHDDGFSIEFTKLILRWAQSFYQDGKQSHIFCFSLLLLNGNCVANVRFDIKARLRPITP